MSDKEFDVQWRGTAVGSGPKDMTPHVVLKQHGAEGMTLEQAKDAVCDYWVEKSLDASRMIRKTALISVDDFIAVKSRQEKAQDAFERHMNRHQVPRTEMWRGHA